MTMLHVTRWNDQTSRVEFLDRDGTITNDRDKAEIWLDEPDAVAAAQKFGGSIGDAFDDDDYDDE